MAYLTNRLNYSVTAGGARFATFRDRLDACAYAKRISAERDWFVEVVYLARRGGGLIDQYNAGKQMAEFAGA